MATLAAALAVTGVAVLGGTGVLPGSPSSAEPVERALDPVADHSRPTGEPTGEPTDEPADEPADEPGDASYGPWPDPAAETALPPGSGTGKRVVFSEGRQRVWLVEGRRKVVRTYLVSGSVYDNLDPGTYAVYSRSENAYGIDDSGTMKYFVRFTQGERAAIGFHDIPVDDGEKVQTLAQLGTPLSHGCIRQRRADARALWRFAPIGTTVVVTA
ncbi:L,D-transpeptidase family protein [Nocardioides sp. SYSU DS0663]|uniref:L,D-transpeptidase family protein n=1 Tax=Nocardioides sp. SYSU DS0663 TaxID=3416445 RepID=UPI003F4B3030